MKLCSVLLLGLLSYSASQAFAQAQQGDTGEEVIRLHLPSAAELLPVSKKLPAIKLEASYNQPASLKDVLTYALNNNLAIRISQTNLTSTKWLFVSSLGGFLPNTLMNYKQQILAGSTLIGGVIPVSFHTPNVQAVAGFQMYGFQGGKVLFGTLTSLHNYRAATAALRGTISDVLLLVTQQYYDLVRSQALLQIQVKAVETSRAQVDLNRKLEQAGTGTRFNVLQSETQLASDQLNLLRQEVAFRASSILLATTLNLSSAVNLLTIDSEVKKIRLLSPELTINELMKLALKHRPELKQYEELRLAARRNIQVAAAPLYPSFQFFGNVSGTGATLGRTYNIQPAQFQAVPLSGTTPAGIPLAQILTTGQTFPVGGVFTPAQSVSRQMRRSYTLGFQIDWNYFNLGVPNLANVQSARALARQALLKANEQFMNVLQQVRISYLNSLIAESEIDVATEGVASATEQLRLARVRLANGVGTNLDVIAAQQSFTQAFISKADAILKFNKAQAQLLRDIGLISLENLTSQKLVK